MDTTSQLIWFFDHFNPYFQCAYVVVLVFCSAVCFWCVARRFSAGVLLLDIACSITLAETTCFIISAFQENQPFPPFLPFELRKHAYLYGRLLDPPQLILFPITVALLALENRRHKRPNQAL